MTALLEIHRYMDHEFVLVREKQPSAFMWSKILLMAADMHCAPIDAPRQAYWLGVTCQFPFLVEAKCVWNSGREFGGEFREFRLNPEEEPEPEEPEEPEDF